MFKKKKKIERMSPEERHNDVLKLDHITKQFSGLTAVKDVSMTMHKRTIHALIGPNGAGKTTTINMITGVNPQTEGQIYYYGKLLDGMKPHERAQLGIGRTFQNLKLFNSMTVEENLMIGGLPMGTTGLWKSIIDFKGNREDEDRLHQRAADILEWLGMTDLKDVNVKNLPYGKQKMTDLGRALMMDPDLLLLDEPAAGLIPSERKEFIDIILKLFEEGTDILMIEHNMDVVMNISTYITVLNFGEKIAEGTPEEIQSNDEVIRAYLGNQFKKKEEAEHAER